MKKYFWMSSAAVVIGALSKVGKKVGNTHISQDGGKYW